MSIMNAELPPLDVLPELHKKLSLLPPHKLEMFTVWMCRAFQRDIRMVGGKVLITRPKSRAEALWSLSEALGVGPDTAIGLGLAHLASGAVDEACEAWVSIPLDGPCSREWRTAIVMDLLAYAAKAKIPEPLKAGDEVFDKSTSQQGLVMEYLPAKERGWRTYELFIVKLDNGDTVQRSRDQLSVL